MILRRFKTTARLVLSQGGFGLVIRLMLLLAASQFTGRAESVVALGLDGKNEFVEISPVNLGSTFTEEAWILPDVHDKAYHGFIGHPAASHLRAPSLWVAYGAGIHAGFGDGTTWHSVSTDPDVLVLQAWNHVAATYDGTTYRIFANGVEVVNKKLDATPLRQGVTRIGRTDYNAFSGAIREVRFWDHVRTAEEIRQNMTKQLRGTEKGLIAYFPFDDGAGNTVRNASTGGVGRVRGRPRWMTSAAPIAPAVSNPQLWDGRLGIATHSPTGQDAAPNTLIEITFREGIRVADSNLIRLTLDNTAVKPEVTMNGTGNVQVSYEPAQPFEPESKHTVKVSYVTSVPTRKTNEFSYSFSVSTSILLSK